MATTLEIINGISQVLANSYDGALNEKGEPVQIGLRREEGNPLIDHRVIDGFGVNIVGDRLHIKYHSEIPLKEVHSNGFESEIESIVEKVKSFLQKEFKKVTKLSLTLSEPSEIDVLVEYVSRVRTSVRAHKCYKIGSIPVEPQKEVDKEFENFVKLGGIQS
tara:strand:+ start:103 stop:588 length:486 start_codon:yes stop_codon:yes gene_type:complete